MNAVVERRALAAACNRLAEVDHEFTASEWARVLLERAAIGLLCEAADPAEMAGESERGAA